jgi:PTH1 family peptidyl-tRNA hydrolase
MDAPEWVLVGLGNPGARYEATRHNIGFRLVDELARRWGTGRETADETCVHRPARIGGKRVILVKPMTFMNRSGEALSRLPESDAAGPARHLVVLDDVALPFGAVRFRTRGSTGGHRGMQSILARFGTDEVPRLRLGVGEGEPGRDLSEYVLESFSPEEEDGVGPWLAGAADGVAVFLSEGAEAAMNRFNS